MKKNFKKKLTQFGFVFLRTSILLIAFFLLYSPALYEYKHIYFCVILGSLILVEYAYMAIKEGKLPHLFPLMCVYIAISVLTTLINDNYLDGAIWIEGFLCLALVALFALGLHYNLSYFLLVFYFYCITIIVWNLFSFEEPFWTYAMGDVAKEASQVHSLIGHANMQIVFFLPALFSGYYLLRNKYFSGVFATILYALVYALCLFCAIYFGTMGNLIVLALWGIFLLLGQWVAFEKAFRPIVALVITLLVFAGTQLYVPENGGIIYDAFKLFERTATLNGRTTLWEEARASIAMHPVIGIGIPYSFHDTVYSFAYHAHNIYLNVLVKTGAIGFAILLVGLFGICRALKRVDDRKIKWAGILFFFCYLFNMQFDVYAANYLYGAVGLLYFASLSKTSLEKREELYWHFDIAFRSARLVENR